MKLCPIAAAASMAVAVSGCTLHPAAGPSGTQRGATVTVTSQPSVQGSKAASPAAPAAPPGTAPVGRCHTSMLRLRLGPVGAAAGQRYSVLTLTNVSDVSCHMYGYVGMQLAFRHGGEVPTSVVRVDSADVRLLTLAPGGQAWSRLHWTAFPAPGEASPSCEATATYLWVTPPDETSQLGRRWLGGVVCQRGQIDAPPMQPGVPTP